jgi:Icc-related predicted phosphoesterase
MNKGYVIPMTMDELSRSEKTLKELREIATEKDIDIYGPKGGLISKQPLLKKIKKVFDKEEEELLSKQKANHDIIVEYNEKIVKTRKNQLVKLKEQVNVLRIEAQQATVKANALEERMSEMRIIINELSEGMK